MAHVAQLVEHVLGKDEVTGSSPVVGSVNSREYSEPATMGVSKMNRLLFGTIFLLILNGCSNSNHSLEPVTPDKGSNPSFNIKDTWRVYSKKCGTADVQTKIMEAYKIDDGHFVAIQMLTEDNLSLCKIGYVYDRVVSAYRKFSG